MRSFPCVIAALLCTAAVSSAQTRVWVQPFTEVTESQQADWINRALHQSLVDELAARGAQVVAAQAKPADVQYVVSGKIQRLNGELRVTGQVTDAADKTVGGFKATGGEGQLFAIEDSIGQQVSSVIAPTPAVAPAPVTAQPQAPAPAPAPANQPQPAAVARVEAPFAPAKINFEGSDLQDAVRRNRPIEARPVIQYETPIYPQYAQPNYFGSYPPYYGNNFGYGGFGFGYSYPSFIVIPGKGGHHGGGSASCPTIPNTGVPANNGQAIRAGSGFGGRTPPPGVVNTVTNTAAPGVIHTMGR
jgi:TolB-like protein